MLTDKDWQEIRTAVDEVVDRQQDDIVFRSGRVNREADGSMIIRLEHTAHLHPLGMDLEPTFYDDGPWRKEVADRMAKGPEQ